MPALGPHAPIKLHAKGQPNPRTGAGAGAEQGHRLRKGNFCSASPREQEVSAPRHAVGGGCWTCPLPSPAVNSLSLRKRERADLCPAEDLQQTWRATRAHRPQTRLKILEKKRKRPGMPIFFAILGRPADLGPV